ncbi:M20 family metallopeptidase [Marinilactibacillus psychrotolerans]|uniref:M20 family metallopeptidase n=1 Tax=Marinilactibacillus psychrotolerans TaxID=191770 RepID=UPI0038838239
MTTITSDTLEKTITDYIETNKKKFIDTSHIISANPEIGNEEFFAQKTLTALLEEAGFNVTRDIAGHQTGFTATKDSGKTGPHIVFLAEYDALPGIGHACGHNAIGTQSTLAGIALSEVIKDVGGKVSVYGTPAEEGGPNGSAKGSFVKAGLFDDVDAALIVHPANRTGLTGPSLAVDPLEFKFFGRTAHASAQPEEGINALDAVIQLFTGINALRQQLKSTIRIHGIITDGGEAPNIIPEYAAARFFIRAETWEEAEEVSKKVQDVARGAALQTGSRVEIGRFQNEVHEFRINSELDKVLEQELLNVGEEIDYTQRKSYGSTDAGNVSRVVPTSHPHFKIGPDTLVGHTKEFREAAISPLGDEALIKSAKVLALSGLKLLKDRETLAKIKEEFKKNKTK